MHIYIYYYHYHFDFIIIIITVITNIVITKSVNVRIKFSLILAYLLFPRLDWLGNTTWGFSISYHLIVFPMRHLHFGKQRHWSDFLAGQEESGIRPWQKGRRQGVQRSGRGCSHCSTIQEPLGHHILQEVLAPVGAVCLQHNLRTMDRVIVYFACLIECIRFCQETCSKECLQPQEFLLS